MWFGCPLKMANPNQPWIVLTGQHTFKWWSQWLTRIRTLLEAYRHWLRFFGPPQTLVSDLGRKFEGVFALRAETDGTYIHPSSVESPYRQGITERAGKTFKFMPGAMQTYRLSKSSRMARAGGHCQLPAKPLVDAEWAFTHTTGSWFQSEASWRHDERRCRQSKYQWQVTPWRYWCRTSHADGKSNNHSFPQYRVWRCTEGIKQCQLTGMDQHVSWCWTNKLHFG